MNDRPPTSKRELKVMSRGQSQQSLEVSTDSELFFGLQNLYKTLKRDYHQNVFLLTLYRTKAAYEEKLASVLYYIFRLFLLLMLDSALY